MYQNCEQCTTDGKNEAIKVVLLNHRIPSDPTIEQQKDQIKKLQDRVNELQAEAYALRRQLKRKSESMDRIKDQAEQCIEQYKKTRISKSSKSTQTTLEVTTTGVSRFLKEIENRKTKAGAYSDYIMDFAFRLFYISPKAYSFVRNVLELTLPNPCTFSRWKKPIDTRPGSLTVPFIFIEVHKIKRIFKYECLYFRILAVVASIYNKE